MERQSPTREEWGILGVRLMKKFWKKGPAIKKSRRTRSWAVTVIRGAPLLFVLLVIIIGLGLWGNVWADKRISEEHANIKVLDKDYGLLQKQFAAAQRLIQRHMLLTQVVSQIRDVSLKDGETLQASVRNILREVPAVPLLYEVRQEASALQVYSEEDMRNLIQSSEDDYRSFKKAQRTADARIRDPKKDGNSLFSTQDIAMAFVGNYTEVLETLGMLERTGTTSWVDKVIIEPGTKYLSDELQLGVRLTAFIWDPLGEEGKSR